MIDALVAGLFDPLGIILLWLIATTFGVAITRVLLRVVQGRNRRRNAMGAQTITALTRSR